MVATSYLLGVSTRRVDKLAEQLGIKHISKSQVSQMAKVLDEQVEAFRTRALDAGPYTFVRRCRSGPRRRAPLGDQVSAGSQRPARLADRSGPELPWLRRAATRSAAQAPHALARGCGF